MQHGCLEDLGLDYTYGVSCLNRVGQDYPNDRGVMMKMNQFALGANLACQEAMMSQEQREEFYQEIPIFMHNFPHIYVFQKRMMEQQQQAQQQQAAGEAQSYFKTAEGMQKMQALSARIQVAKGEAEGSVTGWDAEKRLEYFRSFQDHPALSQMKNSSGDVREKISAFMDLSDSDLTDMMKMQLVLAEDMKSGGSIVKEMQAGGVSKSMMGHMQSMRMMMGSGGTSSGANTHVHGPNCQHHSAGPVAPDVSTGKGDSMER